MSCMHFHEYNLYSYIGTCSICVMANTNGSVAVCCVCKSGLLLSLDDDIITGKMAGG